VQNAHANRHSQSGYQNYLNVSGVQNLCSISLFES